MTDQYLGEIRMFSSNYAPDGWALCNGQLLFIPQHTALFALLGTTYGGDGRATFALPNLCGRVPISFNDEFPLGQSAGEEFHTLIVDEIPSHQHTAVASSEQPFPNPPPNPDLKRIPAGNFWADGGKNIYAGSANATMSQAAITPAGGDQAHENRSPYLVVNFCIALEGEFPPRG